MALIIPCHRSKLFIPLTYCSLKGDCIFKLLQKFSFWQHLWCQGSIFCMDLLDNSPSVKNTNPHQRILVQSILDHGVCFFSLLLLNTADLRPLLLEWRGTKPWRRCQRMCFDGPGFLVTIYLLWCEWGKDGGENVTLLFTDTDIWQESAEERQKLKHYPLRSRNGLKAQHNGHKNAETKEN